VRNGADLHGGDSMALEEGSIAAPFKLLPWGLLDCAWTRR